jgi:hypothetical protein
MTPFVLDSIFEHLNAYPNKQNSSISIALHVNKKLSTNYSGIQILHTLDYLVRNNYLITRDVTRSDIGPDYINLNITHEVTYYYLSYEGYELMERGGFQAMLKRKEEREDFERAKEALELESIEVNTATNKAVEEFIPEQRKQGRITTTAAIVSTIFIFATIVQSAMDNSDKELQGIKTVLEEQVEVNQQLKQSLQELINNQQKVPVKIDSVKAQKKTTKTTDTTKKQIN